MILRKLILCAAITAFLWTPAAAAGPSVSLGGGAVSIPAGQAAPFPVKITDVQGLYGFELQLKFDPAVVEVVDADPDTPGIQSLPGDFLALDLLVRNGADNGAGTIEYVTTQLNPSIAKNGSGTLLTILFKGLSPGASSKVEVVKAQFANRNGERIEVPVMPGEVRVSAAVVPSQSSPTPLPTARPPQVDLTAAAPTPQSTTPPQTAKPAPLATATQARTSVPLSTATQAASSPRTAPSPQPANLPPATITSTVPGPTSLLPVSASPSPNTVAAVPARTGAAPAATVTSVSTGVVSTREPPTVTVTSTRAPVVAKVSKPILPAAAAPEATPEPPSGGTRSNDGILIGGVAIVMGAVALGVVLALVLRKRSQKKP